MRSTLQSLRARREQSDKGFTLIELLVVVVIIGVLIAIAIPLYLNYQKSSHDKASDADVRNAVVVMEQCFSDNGKYPNTTGGTYSDAAKSIDLSQIASGTKCDGKINLSPGTTLSITVASDGLSYTMGGSNAGGHDDAATGAIGGKKTFTYDSTAGGSVGS